MGRVVAEPVHARVVRPVDVPRHPVGRDVPRAPEVWTLPLERKGRVFKPCSTRQGLTFCLNFSVIFTHTHTHTHRHTHTHTEIPHTCTDTHTICRSLSLTHTHTHTNHNHLRTVDISLSQDSLKSDRYLWGRGPVLFSHPPTQIKAISEVHISHCYPSPTENHLFIYCYSTVILSCLADDALRCKKHSKITSDTDTHHVVISADTTLWRQRNANFNLHEPCVLCLALLLSRLLQSGSEPWPLSHPPRWDRACASLWSAKT